MKSLVSLSILLLAISVLSCNHANQQSNTPHHKVDASKYPSNIQLVSGDEPGESMIISGTIYLPDGKTPAKEVILALWQTDAEGNYIKSGGGAGEEHPRIHGRLETGADGKYEFRTIKPG